MAFHRFSAACIKSRPAPRHLRAPLHQPRVAPELVSTRQVDIDVRTPMHPSPMQRAEGSRRRPASSGAVPTPSSRASSRRPAAPSCEEALAADSMKDRRTMFDRARTKAVADCKAASAPGVWRGAETETGIWTATVSNESGAALVVRLRRVGTRLRERWCLLGSVAGKRDRWTGTRAVRDDRRFPTPSRCASTLRPSGRRPHRRRQARRVDGHAWAAQGTGRQDGRSTSWMPSMRFHSHSGASTSACGTYEVQ